MTDFGRDSFPFHIKWYHALDRMKPSIKAEVIDAIFRKAFFNESKELSPEASAAWAFIEPEVEHDTDKWLDIKDKRRKCGSMGGRPKTKGNQMKPNETKTNQLVSENNLPTVVGGSKKRFAKPTVEEVRAYVQEKGYTFDPEAFFAFYESKGWMVGKNPMKNWRAACTTWQKGNKNNSNYGRETITDKIKRSVESANEFSQQVKNRIGEQTELDW